MNLSCKYHQKVFHPKTFPLVHVEWGPSHHCMTCPQAVNRWHSLQALHVTGNILNNKSQRQYSSLQGQCKSCNPSPQKTASYETSYEVLKLERVILLTKYYQDNQTKDKRSGMIKQGQQHNCTPHFHADISRKKDYLEYVDVSLRIMLKWITWEDMQWNHTAQDKVNWDAPVNKAMNFKVSQIAWNFITTYRTITESTAVLLHIVNQSVTTFQHCYNYILSKFVTESVLFLQYPCHQSPCSA
jgi:hypothetical protein